MNDHRPQERFSTIARIITKGSPSPEWIVLSLIHFSPGISSAGPIEISRAHVHRIAKEMRDATDTLAKWLPAFQHLPFGFRCPDDIAICLAALPGVRRYLDRLKFHPRPGQPPNVRRQICAAVIVEIWKLVHSKAEPRSRKLKEACNEYWLACGGEEKGSESDPENWRRPAEHAAAADNRWLRDILLAVQNPD